MAVDKAESRVGAYVTPAQAAGLRDALLPWFDQHKRDLPWRRTCDPYAIWVSEIMLQQTRVAAVLEHYARWMVRFPSVDALAAAGEPEVLALWSGLGYYRRARFLHVGARAVVAEYGGELPRTAEGLRQLPGIGEYTSAAIASIAFGEPVAVVDGNVERVIMRVAGLSLEPPAADAPGGPRHAANPGTGNGPVAAQGLAKNRASLGAAMLAREIRRVAADLLEAERPGDYNQAMMELGATVCLPRAPLCLQCPVHAWCSTRGEHIGSSPKTMQSRSICYALAERAGQGEREVLLVERPADASLMPGMWELPEVATLPTAASPLLTLRHAITVTNYTVHVVPWSEQETMIAGLASRWIPLPQLPETALTGLARKVLKRLALWPERIAL